MMKYLVDISHPAHINFLKYTIKRLAEKNDVCITFIDRGVLSKIVARELKEYKTYQIGKHSGTKLSIIFDANLFRFVKMLIFIIRHKIDVGINGGVPVGMALRLLGRKYIQFDDDIERKVIVKLEQLLANKLCFPVCVPETKGILKFNALKEWAYLSPRYFTPNPKVLDFYLLSIKKYIFVREVSNKSFNYMQQASGTILKCVSEINKLGFKVVFSLEDKNMKNLYPPEWILLEEPVIDIHSLMYFSKLIISSGDSMAREGSLLGVPSIYCGIREMAANKMMIEKKMLLHSDILDVSQAIDDILSGSVEFQDQESFREDLSKEWDDVNEFILNNIELI